MGSQECRYTAHSRLSTHTFQTRTFKTRLDISELKVRRVSQAFRDTREIVDSLKFHVSFAEYRLFYRVLLQKRPVIFGSLSRDTREIVGSLHCTLKDSRHPLSRHYTLESVCRVSRH